ncbi:MAG: hypothetical protein Q8P67_28405 [archaeon]|nr:hypothetical protein [archaeon]
MSSLRDAKGHIFIDRGPRLFKFVLEFLQTGRVSCSPYHGITKAAVMEELSYYQVIPAACLPDSSSRPQMGPRRIRRVVSVGFRADAQQSGGATEEEDHGAAPLMTASGSEQSHPVSPPLSPHSRSPPRGMTTPAHSRALSPPRLELHPQPPEVEESSQGEQDNFDSTTLAGVMESVHDRLQDWHDMAREFFDLNSVSIARKIDQAAAYGSSSVQVLSWSRCRTTANSRDFSHTDTGTDFQNLRSVPCALFLQHLALIIEEEIGFRTRTWTQPYNSKSCRITVHFPILRRSTPPNPGQQELRIAEAIDAFLDLLRSGDYGSRLAVKQEHE